MLLEGGDRAVPFAQQRFDIFPMPPPDRHMSPVRMKSDKPAYNPVNRTRQSSKRDHAFAARFSEALAGRDRAWLARTIGLSASTLHDYSKGAIPSADRAFLIADALGVDARWLVTGEGEGPDADTDTGSGWVRAPYRRLAEGAWQDVGGASLRRDWLRRAFGSDDGLWIMDMPSQSFPEVAREGEPVICAEADRLVEGGLYLVRLEMGVVVRRLAVGTAGHVLTAGDAFADSGLPAFAHGKAAPQYLARILGTLVRPI